MELVDDRHCFVCGENNPRGLKLKFRLVEDRLEAEFTPGKEFQGFRGVLHGGVMALLLDEMMVNLLWRKKIHAVSAEFTMRLKRAAPVGGRIRLSGRIFKEQKRVVLTSATAVNDAGDVLAEAGAKCLKIGASR